MPSYTTSAIIGGVAGALLAALFQIGQASVSEILGIVACLSYLACGLVAVWHYTNEHSATLTGGQGVKLGAYSGVFAGIVGALLGFLLKALNVLPTKEEALAEAMVEIEAAGGAGEAVATRMIEFMYGVGGIAMGLVIAVVLGLVGGAIGRAIWKRGEEEAA